MSVISLGQAESASGKRIDSYKEPADARPHTRYICYEAWPKDIGVSGAFEHNLSGYGVASVVEIKVRFSIVGRAESRILNRQMSGTEFFIRSKSIFGCLGLPADLEQCQERQYRDSGGAGVPKNLKTVSDFLPPGFAMLILGFVMFAYGFGMRGSDSISTGIGLTG